MEQFKVLPQDKSDFKNIAGFLQRNNLVDQKGIWFAGYHDVARGDQNAVARNLFYGNKNLVIVSVHTDTIYVTRNSKKQFSVSIFGTTDQKYSIKVHRNLVYPSIEIHAPNDDFLHIQATKNKQMVKEFKNLLK